MADELEEKLQGKLAGDCEGRIAQKISEFGGLLTRRAAIRLLCKENGIDTERKIALSGAAGEHLPFSFTARVDRIFPVQAFSSGERCVRLHLSDGKGEGTLVLWNSAAAKVEGEISTGDEIACAGAYSRSGEIHLGRGGSVSVAVKCPVTPVGKLTAGACSCEGEVREVYLDYKYVDRKSGGERSMASFLLCDSGSLGKGDGCRRVIVWSAPEGTPRVEEGDRVLLENVVFKNSEIQFNSFSRMVRRASAAEKSGKIVSAGIDGGDSVFGIGKAVFRMPLADALALLGIRKVPQGVQPATLFSIRSEGLAGRHAKYRLEGGRLSWLAVE